MYIGLPLDSKTIKMQAIKQIGIIITNNNIDVSNSRPLLTFLYIKLFLLNKTHLHIYVGAFTYICIYIYIYIDKIYIKRIDLAKYVYCNPVFTYNSVT